ncbi:hypothetical protein [Companilactobacillus futsaii]|uniref:Surface layer protein A domain-containing protein n=2 Tax=Companilactobacillus futsaii TaxID=938155 RepID=A0A5B7T069_9LACO|nr:hypothetical protein [Companilactobacillus futsaii]KRK99563.1 hypothetical protein FC88_GL000013 [Companilactobacillus futsaii JCM 17355]QCX23722.1 hypothetical protein FG051_00780 [Companilactobacillus futsaii]
MKKNVKYIGSAIAVALLAAGAPVVISMMVPTSEIVVNADGVDYNPPSDLPITTFLNDFMSQFGDQYVSNSQVFVDALEQKYPYIVEGKYSYFDPDNPAHVLDLQRDPAVEMLKIKKNTFPLANGNNDYYRDVLGSLKLTDANQNQIILKSADDYSRVEDEFKNNKIPFPITIEIQMVSSTNPSDGYGTYTPPSLETPGVTSDMIYKKFKINMSRFDVTKEVTSPNVVVGSSLSDSALVNNNSLKVTDNYSVTNGDGQRVPIYGKSLFTGTDEGKKAAADYASSSQFNPDSMDSGNIPSGVLNSDNQITKPGTYYQTVSYKLDNGNDKAIEAMLNDSVDPETSQKVNLYKLFINGSNTEATVGTDFIYNKSVGMITIIRPINVVDNGVKKNIVNQETNVGETKYSSEIVAGNTLSDGVGNSLINDSDTNRGITFGDNYYSENTDPSEVLNNDKDSSVNVTDSNGNFIQSGNYLRTITFHLITSSVDTNKFGTEENKDYVLNTDNNTVTYIQKVHIGDPTQKIDVTVDIPDVNVYYMDPVNTDTNELKISTKNGDIISSNVEIGTSYYGSAENALEKTNPETIVKNGVYNSIGDKYRTVTYTLPKNVSYYTFPKTENDVGYTTDGNTVTYVQKVKINRMIATVTVDPLEIPLGTSINDSSVSNENIGLSIKANNKELNHTDPVITFISDNTGYNTNNYFVNKENALDGSPSSTNIIENGKFVHSGTYYRVVRITNTIMPGAYNYQLESDSDNMKVIPGGTRYYYYAQPVIVSEPKETSENINALTVIAGTPSDGASIDGTKLNDSTIYDIKDVSDSGNPNSIVSNVTIGDYYEKENDALEGDKSKTADTTKGLTKSTYYRTITFKLNEGDGYKYSFPNAEKIDAENDEVTYIQKITVDPIVAKVDSATVPEITIKDLISKLPDSSNYALKMKDDTPIHAEVESDTVYEDSNLNTPVKSDTFDKAKTYYRAITFKPTDLSAESYKFNDPNITKNSDGTITYVQPITVNKKSTANWTDDSNKGNNIQNLNVDVTVGDDDSALSNTEGYDLTDAASKSLVDKENNNGILLSPEYYNINSDGTAGEKSDYASGYKIMRPGTYYRQVTFSLLAGVPEDYDFSKLPGYVSSDDNSVTVDQKITATALTPSDDIKDASTTTGTSSTSKSVENPADIALTGKDNASLIKSDPTFDGFYDKDGNKLSDVVDKNGNFTKAGTYYQKVTVPLTDNADYAYDFDSLNGTVNHDAENPTVTFMRTITVNQHHSSGSSTNTNSEDEWTYYQDAGVVTTKTTEPTYSLNNHANETIQNRALSGDSSWVTDQYRVNNRTGVKQYRVATGEWIDANDVYFRDNGNNTEDEWTYYKDPGVVLTKETQEYYSLNNHANETIQNRALSEDSGWITDQYRVNNRTGVKQYRVATGEWIDSHDVIFVKDVQMIVNVDETKDYYNLHDIQKNANSNRALEKKTSWLTDKVAIDYDGSTYYRVATNEWVKQENGVHLDTSVWYKN